MSVICCEMLIVKSSIPPVDDIPAVSRTEEAEILADVQDDDDEEGEGAAMPSVSYSRRSQSKPSYVMGGGARKDGLIACMFINQLLMFFSVPEEPSDDIIPDATRKSEFRTQEDDEFDERHLSRSSEAEQHHQHDGKIHLSTRFVVKSSKMSSPDARAAFVKKYHHIVNYLRAQNYSSFNIIA